MKILFSPTYPPEGIGELLPMEGVWFIRPFGTGSAQEQRGGFMAAPGWRVTRFSMLGRTNDIVTGIYDQALPAAGMTDRFETNAYDAGTEMNTGMMAHAPFYGNTGGPAE